MPDPARRIQRRLLGAAALCLLFLTLPFLLAAAGLPRRASVYLSVPTNSGPFGFLHHEIFERTEPIDLLFVGPSTLWTAIYAPAIEERFTSRFGRKPVVVILGNNWRGEDLTYLVLRDVLARRAVKLAFIQPPSVEDRQTGPHSQAYRWLTGRDWSEVSGLATHFKRMLYAEAVWGAPRHALGLLRRDWRPAAPYNAGWPIDAHGTFLIEHSMEGRPFRLGIPAVPKLSADELLGGLTPSAIAAPHAPVSPYSGYFLDKMTRLAAERGTTLIGLDVTAFVFRKETRLSLNPEWQARLSQAGLGKPPIVGVPGARLLRGLSDEQLYGIYNDTYHLNRNGAEYFTRAVLPALERLYLEHDETRRQGKHGENL